MGHMGHEFVGFKNPPVGLILCARKDEAVALYTLEGLSNKVMSAEYRTALPDQKTLAVESRRTQEVLQKHKRLPLPSGNNGRNKTKRTVKAKKVKRT